MTQRFLSFWAFHGDTSQQAEIELLDTLAPCCCARGRARQLSPNLMTAGMGVAEGEREMSEADYQKSSFFEKLMEHVFISEVLQETWYGFGKVVEVLRSEVDASGF